MNPVLIHEVGPRDGLQIEKKIIPTDDKISWIETILESGVDAVQLGSFVNPDRVPQMADTERLFYHFNHPGRTPKHTALTALVLNEKGLERGFECGVEHFCMGASASDTHSRKNSGMSSNEAMARIMAMGARALAAGAAVQVSVQSAFGCGFEGAIPQDRVLEMVKRYPDAGLTTISLADTAGLAHPASVEETMRRDLDDRADDRPGLPLPRNVRNGHGELLRRTPRVRACGRSKRRSEVSAAVPSPRSRAATLPPRIWCTCSSGWAREATSPWPPW